MQNLDEAYRIIHETNEFSPIRKYDENDQSKERFTKVIKGFNFKDILGDEKINE